MVEQFFTEPTKQLDVSLSDDKDIMIYIDNLMLAPPDYRDVELIFILYPSGNVLPEPKPRLVRMAGILPDFEEPLKQRVSFNFSHALIAPEAPLNLVIELRTANPVDPTQVKSTAWTVMPLYNPAQEPNFGRWRLPMYAPPTKLDVDMRQIPSMPH